MARSSTRSARTRAAILDATVSIISQEGAAAVTPQKVAIRAGVGRATVYRHWPDGAALIQSAMERVEFPLAGPPEGPIEERIFVELKRLDNELKFSQTRRLLSIFLERAERLEEGEDLRTRLVETFVAHLEEALRQAAETGEIASAPDAGEMFDRLVGPLWSRRMLRGRPITDDMIRDVVKDALRPLRLSHR